MTKEHQPHFPLLPDPWPRPVDVIPASALVDVDAPAAIATEVPATPASESHRTLVDTEPSASTGEAADGATTPERERVRLTGRVGAAPQLRTTPKGVLVAKFPLGVREDPASEKPTWHQIYAFRHRAEQVRDHVHRGDAVDVIGYPHERQVPGRHGPRTITEIYATVIMPR